MKEKIAAAITALRRHKPLVHCLTNYVTANECANAVLAVGGSPIMADAVEEAADITARAQALVLNIGTLNARTVAAMLVAGKKANELRIPVVFDPVGAGASAYRGEVTAQILREIRISILRGNQAELGFIAGINAETRGVDAAADTADSGIIAEKAAQKANCIAVVTGKTDAVSDGEMTVKVINDTPRLCQITGTGCLLSAITGAFAGAFFRENGARADMFTAGLSGVAAVNVAGARAEKRLTADGGRPGIGTFHVALFDELSRLDGGAVRETLALG